MAGQNVGSLFVDLEARTAKLEQGLGKAKQELEKFTREGRDAASSTKGLFSDLDVAILATSVKLRLMYGSWRLVTQEVSYAWKNIETIRGVSPEAVASVQRLRGEWQELQISLRTDVAEGVGQAAKAISFLGDGLKSALIYAQSYGAMLGRILSGDETGVDQIFNQEFTSRVNALGTGARSTGDERAAALDPAYWDKVTAARTRLSEAMLRESLAALDLDKKYAELSRRQAAWQKLSETGETTLIRSRAAIEAHTAAAAKADLQRQHETTLRSQLISLSTAQERMVLRDVENAQRLMELVRQKIALDSQVPSGMLAEQELVKKRLANQLDLNAAISTNYSMQERLSQARRNLDDERARGARALLTPATQLEAVDAERAQALKRLKELQGEATYIAIEGGKMQRVVKDEEIKLAERLVVLERERGTLLQKTSVYWRDAANILASGFEKAILSGGKLRDMLKGIANDLLALMIRQTVTMPIANSLTKGLTAFGATLGFAADGGPIPSGMPYIVGERGPELFIPSSSGTIVPNHAMSSGGGGNSYYIDARGADEARIAQLERTIIGLHATVERRAVAAVVQGNRRRGGLGMALAGA